MIALVYWLDLEEKRFFFLAWGVIACKVRNASVDMTSKQLKLSLELALPWLEIRLMSSSWRCYQNPSHLSFKNITCKKNVDRKSRPNPWALNVTDQAKGRSQKRSWKRIEHGGRKVREWRVSQMKKRVLRRVKCWSASQLRTAVVLGLGRCSLRGVVGIKIRWI